MTGRALVSQRGVLLAVGGALALGGCTAGPPAPRAVTEFSRADCGSDIDLASAVSLTPDKDKKIWSIDHPIDASAQCISRDGQNMPYMVFSLPEGDNWRMVEVGSIVEFARLFAPSVAILDEDGAVTREFVPDQYMFRSNYLSVQFVPAEGDRYVVMTSNQDVIGKSYNSIQSGTSSTYLYGGSSWTSGTEQAFSRGYSYEGTVRGQVYRKDDD